VIYILCFVSETQPIPEIVASETREDTIIFVDGVELTEPYVSHAGYPQGQLDNFGTVTVPTGRLFVMGDNREVSYDSRMPEYGPIDGATVIGKPLYIFKSDADRSGHSFH
jgi:signal peptidase I